MNLCYFCKHHKYIENDNSRPNCFCTVNELHDCTDDIQECKDFFVQETIGQELVKNELVLCGLDGGVVFIK